MRKIIVHSFILGLVFQLLDIHDALEIKSLNVWPMPESVDYGVGSLYLSTEFELKTEGSKYVDGYGILKDGFLRLIDLVKGLHVIESQVSNSHSPSLLHGINVVIFSPNDELQYGVNESYKLSIPANGERVYASLEAQTIYGALHGLQTFSQFCYFNFTSRMVEILQVPLTITDKPRFFYRGLLIVKLLGQMVPKLVSELRFRVIAFAFVIPFLALHMHLVHLGLPPRTLDSRLDTSRHYQSLPMIKKVIDSMAYAKLNVLHWHIVDTQSFPLEIPSYPKMWEGSYSISERYTMADAAEIVRQVTYPSYFYAQRRGINVLSEIDVPGHARSWGTGYPSLWPSTDCKEPLDVSNEFTFKVIDGILSGRPHFLIEAFASD
ncbi:hypothetical protein LguiA_022273 [Lonicera macranthoides]